MSFTWLIPRFLHFYLLRMLLSFLIILLTVWTCLERVGCNWWTRADQRTYPFETIIATSTDWKNNRTHAHVGLPYIYTDDIRVYFFACRDCSQGVVKTCTGSGECRQNVHICHACSAACNASRHVTSVCSGAARPISRQANFVLS